MSSFCSLVDCRLTVSIGQTSTFIAQAAPLNLLMKTAKPKTYSLFDDAGPKTYKVRHVEPYDLFAVGSKRAKPKAYRPKVANARIISRMAHFVECDGSKTSVDLMPSQPGPSPKFGVDWTSADMRRFVRHRAKLFEPGALPIGQTVLPFGTTVFDFDPDVDTIRDNCFVITTSTGPVAFWINKRISKRGYLVSLKNQALENVALNPGGLRYIDKMVAEAEETLQMTEFDRPGVTCTKEEYDWYWALRKGTRKERVNAYKRREMVLYGELGLRIKLFHKWLIEQGRYATGSRRTETVKLPDHDKRGVFLVKTINIIRPVLTATQDDWSDVDNRRLQPTLDNMDEGPTHTLGRPTWLKSRSNNPDNLKWLFAAEEYGLERRKLASLKHAEEAHEYNKRLKGQEEDWQPSPELITWDEAESRLTYWPKDESRQQQTAWRIATRLGEMYDKIGLRSAELRQRAYGEPRPEWEALEDDDVARPKRKIKGSRSIIGTTADSFITAPEGSIEWHRANLAEADRQIKLKLGEWQEGCYLGRFHPATAQPTVKELHVATTTDRKTLIKAWTCGPSAKEFILQCRNEAIARIEKLEAEEPTEEDNVDTSLPEGHGLLATAS